MRALLPVFLGMSSWAQNVSGDGACPGEPWQKTFSVAVEPGRHDALRSVFEIPEGKRLTLEQASFLARGYHSPRLLAVLRAGDDKESATLRFPLEYQGFTGFESLSLASPRLQLYGNSGQRISLGLFRFEPYGATVLEAALVGCLR